MQQTNVFVVYSKLRDGSSRRPPMTDEQAWAFIHAIIERRTPPPPPTKEIYKINEDLIREFTNRSH